ncbi:hypothetical protein K1T71_002368 [Dendrolimus kikuchii]|uniref:Uncharacterized protein n=1 Tax=Dendrolimus kikuchii TaxID=765133 RepID=A0ACC1DCQ6_9NEOP|nr:hypothetical protein K1T71_002368 [Dendrolimus kikuchii]
MARVRLILSAVFIINLASISCNEEYSSCDKCIRDGKKWCNDIGRDHCESDPFDGWCTDISNRRSNEEVLETRKSESKSGTFLTVVYAEKSINIGKEHKLDINYDKLTKKSGGHPRVKVTNLNTTQTYDFKAHTEQECKGIKCRITLTVEPLTTFCLSNGTKDEFFHVKLNIEDIEEEVLLKYHVPCQCGCSLKVEDNSVNCNGNGHFSCGVCKCKDGWTGVKCDSKIVYNQVTTSYPITKSDCDEYGIGSNCNWNNGQNGQISGNIWIELEGGAWERTLTTNIPDVLKVYHNVPNGIRNFTFVNTTENFSIKISEILTKCEKSNCFTIYEAEADKNFCSATSDKNEYVFVKYSFDSSDVLVKYIVPCIQPCRSIIERKSPKCNYKGDFSCGSCNCQNGWTGKYCDKLSCEKRRGDVQCNGYDHTQEECYGNGECSECDTCKCYTDRIGYQYFNEENFCSDICQTTSVCDECLESNIPGVCSDCNTGVIILSYKEERLEQRDSLNRTIWIGCNVTVSECNIQYVAMMADSDNIYAMVVKDCNGAITDTVTSDRSIVPIIFGVLALLAAVAAVGGFMIQHRREPSLQTSYVILQKSYLRQMVDKSDTWSLNHQNPDRRGQLGRIETTTLHFYQIILFKNVLRWFLND